MKKSNLLNFIIIFLITVCTYGIITATVSAATATIPTDAEKWSTNGHYYKAYNLPYGWNAAKAYCESKGGHLATISNAEENAFVTALASQAGKNSYWIGIKINSTGNYPWITGEPMSYTNYTTYGSKEPDNYLNNQGYVFMFAKSSGGSRPGQWGDMSENCESWDKSSFWGASNFGFICEWDSDKTSLKDAAITLSKTTYIYDGKEKKPTVNVVLNGKTLKKNTDYTVTYTSASQMGTANVYITGKGKFTDIVTKSYTIVPGKPNISVSSKAHAQAAVTCSKIKGATGYQYFWKKTSVSKYTSKATASSSLTISNIEAGQYYTFMVRAYAKVGSKYYYGDYSSAKKVKIYTGNSIANAKVTLSATKYVYDGTAKKPAVTVKYGLFKLKNNRDYTIKYTNNINAGTAQITITGKGNYYGSINKTFIINRASISNAIVRLFPSIYTYSASAKKPSVVVKANNKLISSTSYTVSYKNNVNAGTATATIQGIGNYTGTIKQNFIINALDINKTAVEFSEDHYSYTGTEIKPTFTVKYEEKQITATNYTASYKNNIEVGTATVMISGKNNLKGAITKTFEIRKAISSPVPDGCKFNMQTKDEGMNWYGYHDINRNVSASTPVYAIADGTVTFLQKYAVIEGQKYLVSYGNIAEFTSSDGKYRAKYCHLNSFNGVNPIIPSNMSRQLGASKVTVLTYDLGSYDVKAGDVLGYIGTTGNSSGIHLHFELYENGNRIDPTTLFPQLK